MDADRIAAALRYQQGLPADRSPSTPTMTPQSERLLAVLKEQQRRQTAANHMASVKRGMNAFTAPIQRAAMQMQADDAQKRQAQADAEFDANAAQKMQELSLYGRTLNEWESALTPFVGGTPEQQVHNTLPQIIMSLGTGIGATGLAYGARGLRDLFTRGPRVPPGTVSANLGAKPGSTEAILSALKAQQPGAEVSGIGASAVDWAASLKRNSKTGQYVGAPQGVDTPEKLDAMVENFIAKAESGIEGRNWYSDTSRYLDEIVPPDYRTPLTGNLAVTSQRSKLDMNYGQALKAHNQYLAGDEVKAGGFPQKMSPQIERLYGGEFVALGPKRGPYQENMMLPDNPEARPVHDIWDGRAWGYSNTDGTPFSTGFSDPQHGFLDFMTKEAIARMNKRKLGGFDDWNPMRAQAAPWVGQRIAAGEMGANEAGMTYGSLRDKYGATATRETAPAPMFKPEGWDDLSYEAKQEIHGLINANIYDAQGRDKIGREMGGLLSPQTPGTGVYEGVYSPGTASDMQVGRSVRPLAGDFKQAEGKGTYAAIDPSSQKLMDAKESAYGLMTVQDSAAWHYLKLNDKTPGYTHNGAEFSIDATNKADFEKIAEHFANKYGEDVVVTHGGGKARVLMLNRNNDYKADFIPEVKAYAKAQGVDVRTGHADLGYIDGRWENGVPKGYLESLDSAPKARDAFDKIAPGMADGILKTIDKVSADYGVEALPIVRQVYQALAEGGLEALRKMSLGTGASAVAALALLSQLESEGSGARYAV